MDCFIYIIVDGCSGLIFQKNITCNVKGLNSGVTTHHSLLWEEFNLTTAPVLRVTLTDMPVSKVKFI